MPAPFKIAFGLTFEEAIEAAGRRKALLPDVFRDELPERMRQYGFSVAQASSLDQVQAVLDSLNAKLRAGTTFEAWKREALTKDWGLSRARLELISRNHAQTAYMAGHWEQFQRHASARPFLMYSAINDSRTRPSHRAMSGHIAAVGDPIWQKWSPPAGHNCFLPGTKVRGDFEIGLRIPYQGSAVEISTASGRKLAVTANHPVLTRLGWVRAQELKLGDDLLCDRTGGYASLLGVVDDQQPPAEVEKVFDALARHALRVAKRSTFNLDGDAQAGEGDIYVAGSDSVLMHGLYPEGFEGSKDGNLIGAHALLGSRPGDANGLALSGAVSLDAVLLEDAMNSAGRAPEKLRDASAAGLGGGVLPEHDLLDEGVMTVPGGPRCGALPDDKRSVAFRHLPLHELGLAPTAKRYSSGEQESGHRRPADAEFFGELLHANAATISPDYVTGVRYFDWSGHVFDFQTRTGLIVADGMVVHNCRCSLISLTADQARARGLGRQVVPNVEPDPGWGHAPVGAGDRMAGMVQERARAAGPQFATVMDKLTASGYAYPPLSAAEKGFARDVREAIAAKGFTGYDVLSDSQILGMRAYAAASFEYNAYLRGLWESVDEVKKREMIAIQAAIGKLSDGVERTTYRGAMAGAKFDRIAERAFIEGKVVKTQTFLSTSSLEEVSQEFGNRYFFVIRGKSAANVDGFYTINIEHEYLFPAGTNFLVEKVTRVGEDWYIELAETTRPHDFLFSLR